MTPHEIASLTFTGVFAFLFLVGGLAMIFVWARWMLRGQGNE